MTEVPPPPDLTVAQHPEDGRELIGGSDQWHPVRLTDEEALAYGRLAGAVQGRIEEADALLAAAKAAHKVTVEPLRGELTGLLRKTRTGEENREVYVEFRYDHRDKRLYEVRTDTGEVVEIRDLSDKERQRVLGF